MAVWPDHVRVTAERLVQMWLSPQLHMHKELLQKLVALSPRTLDLLVGLLGTVYSKHTPTASGVFKISGRRILRVLLKAAANNRAQLATWLPGLLSDVLEKHTDDEGLALLDRTTAKCGCPELAEHVQAILLNARHS
jgi:hypothetical protein